ncbi:histidine phosphatase superfamily [Crepidotus variabilis]|uniref:Histidine phosphatase superfamily n=1 Tax=Crepidotus variabilis TaxID=179855 RepID=A0A9P6JPL7_9AGAR|nr:histidine phosphatase superfamily [Crepidotus variabilis]
MARPMPRLFVVRHGETEWSQNGRHTGLTDIPLTSRGEDQVRNIATRLVGKGLALDPENLCVVHVSPRQRAHRTFHLLFEHLGTIPNHVLDEDVQEWNYGDYEGMVSSEIKKFDPKWWIWNDGCPGGESAQDMEARVDRVIEKVRAYHREYKEKGTNTRDVMIVAHGHFNRVLIARWIKFQLCLGTHFNVEPGSVAILGYNHNNLEEPALNALNLFSIVP